MDKSGEQVLIIAAKASTASLLFQYYRHIGRRRRLQFVLLIAIALIASLAEVFTIGAVLPFINILTRPERPSESLLILGGVMRWLDEFPKQDVVIIVSSVFAVSALFAGALRLILLWASIKLGNATGVDISIEAYRRALYQDYQVHIHRNSSEVVSGITQKVHAATGVLISVVAFSTASILFTAIMVALLLADPLIAFLSFTSFGFAYAAVALRTRRRLVQNGECIAREQTAVMKALQEGLGAIRDVLLDGTQQVYCDNYSNAVNRLQSAGAENSFISQAPRYAMEAFGMALIAVFVIVIGHREGGLASVLPVLGMFALGAQRLLPLMQQIYGNLSAATGSKAVLADVLALLDQPLPKVVDQSGVSRLPFLKEIRFQDVSYRYGDGEPLVLNGLNLSVPRGARVGIVGSTGSGKSTATDLLMGLLTPTAGRLLVDGHEINLGNRAAWQRNVAHVPQSIFLSDSSIAQNIAFGIPSGSIDMDRVKSAARQAQIAEFVESKPAGYDTLVGERGIRLSGGQRQRLGIARALYKEACVLIFDEATSALDNETEQGVMRAINGLSGDLTLFIVAHRLSTLKACMFIVEMDAGKARRTGSYQEIVGTERD
jgi:ATP-binding cassette, subfamily B, bacterial PglK